MGYNSKEIKVQPTEQKKTNPYRKDVIVDPAGQWKYPGQVTKIPSNQITMQGVPYPVLGVDNLGNKQMMMPGAHYTFPGDNVTEYPQMQHAQQGASVTGYNEEANYMGDKFKDVGASVNMGRVNLNAGNYFPTRTGTPEKQPNFNPYLQLNYDAGKNRSVGIDAWPGYAGVRFSKTFQDGGEVTPEQAQAFLDAGDIYGHPLTQALRSLEQGRFGLGADGKDVVNIRELSDPEKIEWKRKVLDRIKIPRPHNIYYLRYGFQLDLTIDELFQASGIDPWFLYNIKQIVDLEEELYSYGA